MDGSCSARLPSARCVHWVHAPVSPEASYFLRVCLIDGCYFSSSTCWGLHTLYGRFGHSPSGLQGGAIQGWPSAACLVPAWPDPNRARKNVGAWRPCSGTALHSACESPEAHNFGLRCNRPRIRAKGKQSCRVDLGCARLSLEIEAILWG